jgi:hypothetical protein
MKKIIFLLQISCISFSALHAQEIKNKIKPVEELSLNPKDLKDKNNCCTVNPYTLTACSQSLFQSFKNLTAAIGVSNCHATLNYPTVSFAMPENCFTLQTTSASMVTYSSFYVPTIPEFRVIWGATAASFSYYGACAPNPIIFPHPGITENHVFGAKLIKQSDYKAFAGSTKDYNTMLAVPSVNPADIEQITSVYMEEQGGYISKTEQVLYNNMLSSKGIVVKVKLKNAATILCYIINNYDTGGTINWKENNAICLK